MRRTTFALIMLIAGALPATAADWASLPAMPTARFGAGAAALNGDFYVLGGSDIGNLANVSVWNETSGTWSSVASMATARQFPGAVAAGGRIYAVGGYGPFGAAVSTVERFDPAANAWSSVAAMPGVRALAGVVELGGMIYVMTGEGDAGVPQATCYRFDPGAGAWSLIPSLSSARSGPAAAVLNGEVYVMGGANGVSFSSTEIFNPSTGWRAGPAMPEGLWMPSAATFDGRIWVVGGFDAGFNRSDRVYSLGTDGVWRQESSMPIALAGTASASNGMRLVVAGGMNSTGQPVAAALERMSTSPPPPPPPPPPAEGETLLCSVEVSPHTLNLKSFGNWISAEITPENGNVLDIDVATLTLGGVPVDMSAPVSVEENELSVKFPRDGFRFLSDGEVSLALEGLTHTGNPVSGHGWIQVSGGNSKEPHSKPLPALQPGRGNGRFAGQSIEFTLETPMTVSMDVIDVQGRRLGEIANGVFSAGTHTVEWSGSREAATGVYFVRARFDNETQFMRFAVIR